MSSVLVINGPNLNLLGRREPEIYGTETLAQLEERCVAWGGELGLDVTCFQSNHEGDIIDSLHATDAKGVVINPGAFTHYSYAIYDALVAVGLPAVEVHLSDINVREPWRRQSVIRPACLRQISGAGPDGYRQALETLATYLG